MKSPRQKHPENKLKSITRDSVLKTIQEFDRIGRKKFLEKYGYGSAKAYWLVYEYRNYDSKAIIGVARKYVRPGSRPLKCSEFSGGKATVQRKLENLGFTVWVDRNDYLK